MNDIDTEKDLRDYYRSIEPVNSVHATSVVIELLAARREGTAKGGNSVRPFAFAAVVVSLTIVAVGSLGLVTMQPGTAASSPSADASRLSGPQGSPTMALWTAPPVMMPGSTRPPTAAPGYHATGVMTEARSGAVAALLADGRVLLAGGNRAGDYADLASAELFDPGTGTFTPTGSMYRAFNEGATATLLLDGRVLVVDGWVGASDAELYDPATGTFSQTGPMLAPIGRPHTATRLADGRVLILGSNESVQPYVPALAEIYDPKMGKFTYAPSMPSVCARYAVLLEDGRVFVAGSDFTSGSYAQIYDPATGNFGPEVAYPLGGFQSGLGPVLLRDGRVFLADQSEALIYDPATRSFASAGMLNGQPGVAPRSVTLLPDGRVLIGMANQNMEGVSPTTPVASLIYDPATNTFIPTGLMTTRPGQFTATLLKDGRVLFAGGDQDNGPTSYPPGTCELYDPRTNVFTATGS
jgi:hypothetical protein